MVTQWRPCSILTTTPNAVTAVVHDRMPVILDVDSFDLWLDPGMKDVDLVSELLKPCSAPIMRSYPVSARVNQVANDDEEVFCTRVNPSRLRVNCFSSVIAALDLARHVAGWSRRRFALLLGE